MANDKTKHQVQRFLNKLAEKYPSPDTPEVFTDIHIRVTQETGDVMAFDDDDKEITRVVVEEWINASLDTDVFYNEVAQCLRAQIEQFEQKPGALGIIEPYNYVLENEAAEHVAELYVVDDDDTIIIGHELMDGLDKELDEFIDNLLKTE